MIKETKTTKIIRIVACWFVGLVFLFSSFTKGVDPMGTAYKIVDYMRSWDFFGMNFTVFIPLAPFLSMLLITLEFLVGVMLLTGSFRKLTSWILLLMMAFFTCTTLYGAITNKVDDCGCFGDIVKLTNWQTFWKNIILLVPTIYIFLTRKWPRRKRLERDLLIAIAAIAAMVIFGLYNINNEPLIDARPWKIGNKMMDNTEPGLPTIDTVTYRNIEDPSQVIICDSRDLMKFYAEDSLWFSKWQWIDTSTNSTTSPYMVHADGFSAVDAFGQDATFDLIAATEGPVLICTIHHLDKVNERGIRAIAEAKQVAADKGARFAVLAFISEEGENGAHNDEEKEAMILKFLYENRLMDVEYYFGDEKAIETMLRSNPGFILMRNAVVKGKWHYKNVDKIKDFPFNEND